MATPQENVLPSNRQLLSLRYIWSLLRMPETFALSLALFAWVLALLRLIPQHPTDITSEVDLAVWIETLPLGYQQLASLLEPLGLFGIMQSAWFWFPAAWLLLICLIIVADYGSTLKLRLGHIKTPFEPTQQHPFHHLRQEQIAVTAPAEASKSAASSEPLANWQTILTEAGYQTHLNADRQILLARRFWQGWLGPVFMGAGGILLIIGLVIQTLWGNHQTVAIAARGGKPAFFNNQPVVVRNFTPKLDSLAQVAGGEVSLSIGSYNNLDWQFHRPYRLDGWWIILGGIQPVAQVELQLNDNPVEVITPAFPAARKPAYFISANEALRFELRYRVTPAGPDYTLHLLPSNMFAATSPNVEKNGSAFSLPENNLRGTITLQETVQLSAYKLPGLGVGVIGLILLLSGWGVLAVGSPQRLQLTLLTKGRGSRIEVQQETLRQAISTIPLPSSLLIAQVSEEEETSSNKEEDE